MEVRKRRLLLHENPQPVDKHDGEENKKYDAIKNYTAATELKGSFWLTRIVFIRSLGFVYCKRL